VSYDLVWLVVQKEVRDLESALAPLLDASS